jgi:hypothetical protein
MGTRPDVNCYTCYVLKLFCDSIDSLANKKYGVNALDSLYHVMCCRSNHSRTRLPSTSSKRVTSSLNHPRNSLYHVMCCRSNHSRTRLPSTSSKRVTSSLNHPRNSLYHVMFCRSNHSRTRLPSTSSKRVTSSPNHPRNSFVPAGDKLIFE